jgi:predicted TIM-barrel fold metal-dependent hydrolase
MGPGFSPVREKGELTYIDGSKEKVLKLLNEAKIDKAVALPFNPYPPHPKVKPLRYYGKELKGYSDMTNEFVANLSEEHPDRFIGFAVVNPKDALYSIPMLEYAVYELGLKGVKIYPGAWKFYPNDPDVFPVYRKAVELGIPVMFCTSLWSPFYGGAKYAQPVYIDDVVRTFPDGKFVIAHFGAFGLGEESLAIACNYENVY